MCSSVLSVRTVTSKVVALKKVKEDNKEEENQPQLDGSIQMNDSQVLHTASGNIRTHLSNIKDSCTLYHSLQALNPQAYAQYIPGVLYDFVQWCVRSKAYTNASSSSITGKNDLRIIAICHNIIGQCQY